MSFNSPPQTPADQLFYGPLYATSYADRNLHHLISSSPQTVSTMRQRYGRYLAGLDGESMSGKVGYDPQYQDQHVYDLEKEDDTFGSGIFDAGGRGGTSNANMGVFASHYSLPGFIARDVPFRVQSDVTDITDGAAVVSIPGGGLLAVDDRGTVPGRAGTPPTWRPAIQPPGWTDFDQVYVDMAGKPVPMNGVGTFGDMPRPSFHYRGVPTKRRNVHRVPQVPAERPVGYRSIVAGGQVPVPVHPVANPVTPLAPDLPRDPAVPAISTVNVATQSVPISGLGATIAVKAGFNPIQQQLDAARQYNIFNQGHPGIGVDEPEKKSPSALQLAFAGLLVGAAGGMIYNLTKGSRR